MDFKETWEKFFATWKKIVTQPEVFFSEWNQEEELKEVIIFNVICGLISGLLTTVLSFFSGIGSLIIFPVFLVIGTVVGGVILFICFKLVGGDGEIEPTIKMVGYTQAVRALFIGIPFVGFVVNILVSLYQFYLLVIGGKTVHKLDTTKSAIAVLIPVVLIGGLLLVGAVLFGLGMMGVMMGMGRG